MAPETNQNTQTADPYAAIATPASQNAAAPAASADPYASIATPVDQGAATSPANPNSTTLGSLGEEVKGLGSEFVDQAKNLAMQLPPVLHGDVSRGAASLLPPAYTQAVQGVEELPDTLKAYEKARAQGKSPVDAAAAASGVQQAKVSAVTAIENRLAEFKTNPSRATGRAIADLIPFILTLGGGAEVDGVAAASKAAAPAANAVEDTSALQKYLVNPFKRAIASPAAKGEQVATDASTVAAKKVAGSNSLLNVNDVQTPLAEAKSLYQMVDKAAGTNLDDMYTKLANAQDRAMQTISGSHEEAVELAKVKAQEEAIAEVKQRAADAGVKDVDQTLAQADKKFTEAQANKEFNYKFSKAVEGKSSIGVPESVKTEDAIRIVREMTEPTVKYPTPRAYQTTMGKAGADKLLKDLYAARDAGKVAVDLRKIRNYVGGAALGTAASAGIYEAGKDSGH